MLIPNPKAAIRYNCYVERFFLNIYIQNGDLIDDNQYVMMHSTFTIIYIPSYQLVSLLSTDRLFVTVSFLLTYTSKVNVTRRLQSSKCAVILL